jgi:GDP-mannose pyrophosphatase NudK
LFYFGCLISQTLDISNERVRNLQTEILSSNWYVLNKVHYEYRQKDGSWLKQSREAYDRGNGAAILLYNREAGTIVLTNQFRMPTYINGNESGMLIEVCAGLLDKDNPEDCIRRETEEETGYKITQVKKVYECYMSPGSVTEILFLFVAEYSKEMKVAEGGGLEEEHENIEVLELKFSKALEMVASGVIKDAKTIMLLQYARLEGLV